MVKGAARNVGSTSSAPPQALPTMQSGQNVHDPLTQLNSHQGFGLMSGFNPFADMGLNPNDPNMVSTVLAVLYCSSLFGALRLALRAALRASQGIIWPRVCRRYILSVHNDVTAFLTRLTSRCKACSTTRNSSSKCLPSCPTRRSWTPSSPPILNLPLWVHKCARCSRANDSGR